MKTELELELVEYTNGPDAARELSAYIRYYTPHAAIPRWATSPQPSLKPNPPSRK